MEDTSKDDVSLDNLLNPQVAPDANPNNDSDVDADDKDKDTPGSSDNGDDKPTDDADSDNDDKLDADTFKSLVSTFVSEDNLDDENKALRKDLLNQYKGEGFDVNGNIIDKEGNVVANFDDVLNNLNNDNLTLDAQGNEINSQGEIIRTAYELAVENTVVNKLAKETGYELLDEQGNPKIYSDDDEGFKALTKDISEERFKEYQQEFFSQNPVLTEVAKHLLSGNSLDTFQQATDYSNIDVTKISNEEKENYIRRSLEVKGIDKEQIDSMIQLVKDSNSLTDQAAKALPALQAYEAERVANRDAEYQKTIEDEQKRIDDYWNEANSIITKGKVSNIVIPENDREAFYDYISTAIDDKGNSKEAIDIQKETLEDKLAYSYLRYKGFDLQKLVKSEVKKDKALSLKERIKRSKQIKDSPLNDAKPGITSGGTDVTLSDLLS